MSDFAKNVSPSPWSSEADEEPTLERVPNMASSAGTPVPPWFSSVISYTATYPSAPTEVCPLPVVEEPVNHLRPGQLRISFHRWRPPLWLSLGDEWAWGYGFVTVMWRRG